MSTMRAYRLMQWQQQPELCDVGVPEPQGAEVLLRIGGAGACHSDLHIMRSAPGERSWTPPFTLGHENAGWVEALGPAASGVVVGDPVAVYGAWGCATCRFCREGRNNYCERRTQMTHTGGGLGADGGLADFMLVPSTQLLAPLGDLHPVDAAPLTDAALTSYHAIKRSLGLLVPGSNVLVIGVGGLGHLAVQLVKVLSPARVLAVDVDPTKLELAREMGADVVVEAGPAAEEAIREATSGLGAELVLDFVGRDETLALAAACVRTEGAVTIVGAGGGRLDWRFASVAPGATWSRTLWGTATDFTEVLELARSGVVRAHVERFTLEDAGEAYARMRAGTLQGRAVIVPEPTINQEAAVHPAEQIEASA